MVGERADAFKCFFFSRLSATKRKTPRSAQHIYYTLSVHRTGDYGYVTVWRENNVNRIRSIGSFKINILNSVYPRSRLLIVCVSPTQRSSSDYSAEIRRFAQQLTFTSAHTAGRNVAFCSTQKISRPSHQFNCGTHHVYTKPGFNNVQCDFLDMLAPFVCRKNDLI